MIISLTCEIFDKLKVEYRKSIWQLRKSIKVGCPCCKIRWSTHDRNLDGNLSILINKGSTRYTRSGFGPLITWGPASTTDRSHIGRIYVEHTDGLSILCMWDRFIQQSSQNIRDTLQKYFGFSHVLQRRAKICYFLRWWSVRHQCKTSYNCYYNDCEVDIANGKLHRLSWEWFQRTC